MEKGRRDRIYCHTASSTAMIQKRGLYHALYLI